MLNQPQITLKGWLTRDPEVRFTASGKTLATFDVAHCERVKNRQTQQWEDGKAEYWKITLWGRDAEAAAESLKKGDKVLVTGGFRVQYWTDNAGVGHSRLAVDPVHEIGKIPAAKRSPKPNAQAEPPEDPWANTY